MSLRKPAVRAAQVLMVAIAIGALLGALAGAVLLFMMPRPGPAEPMPALDAVRVLGVFALIGAVVGAAAGGIVVFVLTAAKGLRTRD